MAQKPKAAKPAAPNETISAASSDLNALPRGVTAMRDRIVEACARARIAGDCEPLRIPIDSNETRPLFERGSKRGPGADPINTLKSMSFDSKGMETIAILEAAMAQPYVIVARGEFRMFVWPAIALRIPAEPTRDERIAMASCLRFADLRTLSTPTPPVQKIGIGGDGTWHYFWGET